MVSGMSTTEEIEAAIRKLPEDEFCSLIDRLIALREQAWSNRIREDAAGGKLNFLFEEAEVERKAGTLREWPKPE